MKKSVHKGVLLEAWQVRDAMIERAAIAEFDGGLTREEAEALAKQSGIARTQDEADELLKDWF